MTRAIIARAEGDTIISAGGPYVITAQGIELISTLSYAAQQAADGAALSETNAAASASAAAGSASAASGSATSAAGSATAAGNAKTDAETAAGNAATSATTAGSAATAASGSATAAAGSATSASGSATAAGQAKDAAETAASSAGTSASAAAGSATAAGNSAGAANSSASAAAGSASSASGSATAAGQAKDAAETALNELRSELPNFTYAVSTLAPGSDATLVGSGAYPNITLTFGVPRGEPAQDPNFTATASTGAAGSDASVSISGTYPNLAFSFSIPRGADGSGAVSSVGLSVPTGLSVANSPITSSGTLTITYQAGYRGYTVAEGNRLAGMADNADATTATLMADKVNALPMSGAVPSASQWFFMGNGTIPRKVFWPTIQEYLANRANHTGSQAISTITGLQATLDDKELKSAKGAANGYASLDASGKIPSAQMPPIALTEPMVVNNQAAMLALTAQPGDVAIRTDLSKTFMLRVEPASTLANWIELLSASAGVMSINGHSGPNVTLNKGDVGLGNADNTADANKPVSTQQQTALNGKLPNNGGSFSGGYPGPDPVALTDTNLSPTLAQGHERSYTNNGAFTLNAPAGGNSGTICIAVTNGASSGALNALGFNKVHGTFDPAPNKKQLLVIEVHGASWKTLSIRDDT